MKESKKTNQAVALSYDQKKDGAPRVVATGKGIMAQKILAIAEKSEVPIYKDPSLVKILSQLDLGSEIPGELYQIVAEVLAFVYNQDKKLKSEKI